MKVVNRTSPITASVSREPMDRAPARLDLESAADALLEAAGIFRQGSGVYTGRRLERKIRNDRRRTPQANECEVPHEVIEYLLERLIDDLVDVSSLTTREEVVFRLHASGLGCRDMAATLGIKHQAIAFRLRRALRKVRASYREGRYAGWYEVYLSEVNRPVYRSPRHRARLR